MHTYKIVVGQHGIHLGTGRSLSGQVAMAIGCSDADLHSAGLRRQDDSFEK
jgi:hypothetical protein